MLTAKENIVWRKKKELLVVLDTESGSYFTLNETAQDLWMAHVVDGKDLETAVDEIMAKFDNNPNRDQVVADCLKMIDGWKENGLVVSEEA